MHTTFQSKLNASFIKGLTGKLATDSRPLRCQNYVRVCWEDALGLPSGTFYKLIKGESPNPLATECERSFKRDYPQFVLPKGTKQIAGDICYIPYTDRNGFNWGHVWGVALVNGILVAAQNTIITRNVIKVYRGNIKTVKLDAMPQPTTIVRFPADYRFQQ